MTDDVKIKKEQASRAIATGVWQKAMQRVENGHLVHDKKVIITLPVLLTGGTEIQTKSLVKVLVSAGFDVTVCCFYDFEQSMVAAMEKTGARVVLLRQNPAEGLWILFKKLVDFFRQEKPHICHVQYMAPGFIPVLAARLANVPVVFATVHQPGHPYGKKAHLLLRVAASLCTVFTCISRSVEKSWFSSSTLFNVHSKKAELSHCTVYNAVDVTAIAAAVGASNKHEILNKYHIGHGAVIGCVARLRVEKGQKTLVKALAEVVKAIPAVKLLMIGDGPDKMELMRLSEDLGVSGNIVWLGQQDQAEVYKLYGVMDIVVVPSLFEGFGLVAAEAMAAGLPVIASNVDGVAEVVKDGETGALFPVGNWQALAESLIHLLNNPQLAKKFGQNGRDRVQEYFSLDQFSASMLRIYGQYQFWN